MTQAFTVEDLFLHQKITALHCVPPADSAVCTVKSIDRENDQYVSHLWAFRLDGSGGRQLSDGDSTESSPRWAPEGDRLAFLSNRSDGRVQVHVMQPDGTEPRQVGDFPAGVMDLRWTPSGQRLVVTAAVNVDPNLRGERSSASPPTRKIGAPEVAWRLPYKADGVGYLLQREIHLFTLDAGSGVRHQLTDGAFEVMGFDASPDGEWIAYTRTREGRFAHFTDLWMCDVDGRNHRRMTVGHAVVMQPAWSPDGRYIAFTGAEREGDAQSSLWLVEPATGEVRQLGGGAVDVADPESVHWTQDGSAVVLVRAHRGRHQVVEVDVASDEPTVLVTGDRQLSAFGITEGRLAYCVDQPSLPSELWSCPRQGGQEVQVSQLNPWWNDRTPIVAQSQSFEVPNGLGGTETIEGWLLHAEREGNAPMPLLNDIHGGPASYALLDFDSNVFWQVLCSRGWAVLALNAVGSSSYGREFCNRLAGHWGEYDLPQHLEAITQLRAEGLCDDRVTVSGKSYGGYLTSWATGHTTLFQAAVVMAPVGNIETHYGTSDGGHYADPFYMATQPAFDRELARKLSPLQYIERSTTPTLFLQGKDDERCPKCQSEELFVSLLRAGDTPAELVLYPGEGHGFLGQGAPSCREDAAARILAWLGSHVAGSASAADEGTVSTSTAAGTEDRPSVREAEDSAHLSPAER